MANTIYSSIKIEFHDGDTGETYTKHLYIDPQWSTTSPPDILLEFAREWKRQVKRRKPAFDVKTEVFYSDGTVYQRAEDLPD